MVTLGMAILIALFAMTGFGQAMEEPTEVVAPAYPLLLLHGSQSGSVTLKLEIDKSGVVSSATLKEGSKLLFQVAKRAALKWKYAASAKASLRVCFVTFKFTLLASDASPEDARVVFTLPNVVEIRERRIEIRP